MLVSFAITNHTCFRDRAELSLVAAGAVRDDDRYTFGTAVRRHPRLNRVTAIYGPNGSGKSRLVQGLAFAQFFVLESAQGGQVGDEIVHRPFLFDVHSRREPTTFEISFIHDGTTYEFGFSLDETRVREEWLFAWPTGGRMRRLVERKYDTETSNDTWYFGPSVHGPKETWRASTRPNALFVSTAAQLNSDLFRPVIQWFQKLRVVSASGLEPDFTVSVARGNDRDRGRVLALLHDASIAVSDLTFEQKRTSLDELKQYVSQSLLDQMTAAGQTGLEEWKARFGHVVKGGKTLELLDLEQESDGTQRLFAFAGPWLDVLDQGRTVVVDELDRSLHPHLVASMVRRINSAPLGDQEKRAQLVMSVHGPTLLQDVLDRTQIWFTEKDQDESARLFPLSDFHPRRNESLMRGYLGGRYGGVPVVTESTLTQ